MKLTRKSKILLISLFLSLSIAPSFAKEKVTLPDDVQKKISSFQATKTSWYIRKASGTKAGKVVYGPYETKEQALIMWLFYDLPENKSYCIAKNETFLTKTPKAFYKKDIDSLITQVDENGLLAVLDKFFLGIEYLDIENPEPDTSDVKVVEIEEQKNEKTDDSKKEDTVIKNDVIQETKQEESISIIENEAITEIIVPEIVEVTEKPDSTDIIEEAAIVTTEPEVIIPETIVSTTPIVETIIEEKELIPSTPAKTEIEKEILKTPVPEIVVIKTPFDIVNPNEQDNKGRTALMRACETGNDWEISSLINAGANVNIKDKDGWTALMYAVRYQQNVYVVKSLIDAGADVKIKNNFNLTALIYAANYNNNPEILKLIINKYSSSDAELMQAFVDVLCNTTSSEYSLCAKAQIFIEMGLSINNLYKGKTPLMYAACYSKSTKIIELLMKNGASTAIKSAEGKTAFEYATENKELNHDSNYWALSRN